MHIGFTGILLLLLLLFFFAAVITQFAFPVYYRGLLGLDAGIFARRSFSVLAVINLARKTGDMTESFKSFYSMKYQNAVFIIKGLGSTIVLFISPFLEKIVKNEKGLTNTDWQLLVITAVMLLLLIYLSFGLRKIMTEYAETIRIYHIHRP